MKKALLICSNTLTIGLALTLSCNVINVGGIQGSGNIKNETRNTSGFKKIKAGGAVNLEISVQKDFSVEVETDDNLLEYVKTETDGDTLIISTKDRISPKTKINVKISLPELVDLNISGASSVAAVNVKTDSLKLEAVGASKIKIDGEVKSLEADATGASGIDAENLKTENAQINANGASNITVSPTNELDAAASGASRVTYTGEPQNIKQNVSGASSIKKK